MSNWEDVTCLKGWNVQENKSNEYKFKSLDSAWELSKKMYQVKYTCLIGKYNLVKSQKIKKKKEVETTLWI